jgi:hypothetical protein
MAIGDELSSINFESMIGGPLSAVIKAQAQAAVTSVDFIKAVGFDSDDEGNVTAPVMVTFSYDKPVEETDEDTGETTITPQKYNLTVPFLTMLPVPFIRVEETTIDFNAKITSIQESSATSKFGIQSELTAKAGWLWGSASLKVNTSYQRSTSSSQKVERTYSMAVHVRAVQDELPAGTERLLGILENVIEESPAA